MHVWYGHLHKHESDVDADLVVDMFVDPNTSTRDIRELFADTPSDNWTKASLLELNAHMKLPSSDYSLDMLDSTSHDLLLSTLRYVRILSDTPGRRSLMQWQCGIVMSSKLSVILYRNSLPETLYPEISSPPPSRGG